MRKIFALLMAVVLTSLASAQGTKKPLATVNQGTAAPARLQPVSYSNLYCSGFVTNQHVPHNNYIEGGWASPNGVRYSTGEYIYIHGDLPEGSEFDIVREVTDPSHYNAYPGQGWSMRGLGTPYADIGRAKVVAHAGKVSVGMVEFSCETALPGDFAIPYREREPVNVASLMAFDPFNADTSSTKGRIVMARDYDVYVAAGQTVYLNVGSDKGVKVGDYFRAIRGYTAGEQDEGDALSYKATIADDTQKHPLSTDSGRLHFGMSASTHDMPHRGLGELVVVGVTRKTATAMLTFTLEEVRVGDRVVKDEQPTIVIGPVRQPGSNAAGPAMASASSANALAAVGMAGMQPPSIACIAQPERLRAGAMATISCDATSPDLRPVNVTFSADRGEISGEGSTGLLQTAGLQPGMVHVLATALDDRNLSSSAGTIVRVEGAPVAPVAVEPPPPPAASKVSEVQFKPSSVYVNNDAKAKLDDFTLRAQRDPQMKIVIVGQGKLGTVAGKRMAERRAENVKTYLTRDKGIDASRIETRTQAGENRTDLWLIPPGASMPEPEAQPNPEMTPKGESQSQAPPKDDKAKTGNDAGQQNGRANDEKPQATPAVKDPFSQPQDSKPQAKNHGGTKQSAAKDNKTQAAKADTKDDSKDNSQQNSNPQAAGRISQKAPSGGDSALQDAVADSTDRNTIGQMLIEREQESWARRKAGDATYFEENVPDDFQAVDAGKKIKQRDLGKAARFPMSDYNLSDFDVAFPDANTAVVTYHADYSVLSRGAAVHEKRKVISRWVKRDGDWENVDDVFKKIQSLLRTPEIS